MTETAARVFASELGCVLDNRDPGFADPLPAFQIMWVSGLGAYLRGYLPEWEKRMDPGLVDMVKLVEQFSASDYANAFNQRAALWDTTRKFSASMNYC